MRKYISLISFAAALAIPGAALAYVGPGAGLSLLGALWALAAAVGTALLFVIAWPLRKALRRRRAARAAGTDEHGTDAAGPTPAASRDG